jgi:hypothetical protein
VAGDIFDVLILNGRPASGKSETIDFLKKMPADERRRRFHIGELDEIDDFPMLWTWFEEDAIRTKILDQPRVHTDDEGYFLHRYQWHLLIRRMNLEYEKRVRDVPGYHQRYTTLIEFSRGTEHGGYAEAYPHLAKEILERAGIVYIDVSYEESKRKNRRRYNPSKPDSILEHGLPDDKLDKMYREVDWESFTSSDPAVVRVNGVDVPYAVLANEPEVTHAFDAWAPAFEKVTGRLWSRVGADR